jgi:hypothetical protein
MPDIGRDVGRSPGTAREGMSVLAGKLTPIEIKWKEKLGHKDVVGIKKFIEMYGEENVSKRYVACNTRNTFSVSGVADAIDGWDVWKSQMMSLDILPSPTVTSLYE